MTTAGKDNANNRKSLFLFFGPATTINLLVAVVAAIFAWSQLSSTHKVQIERQVVPKAGVATVHKPSAEQLLNWQTQLQLTEMQKEKLKRVVQEEQVALGQINVNIDRHINVFNHFAMLHKTASLADIEIYRRPLCELSRSKRVIQHGFEEQGMELLTADQQATALKLHQSLVSGLHTKQR